MLTKMCITSANVADYNNAKLKQAIYEGGILQFPATVSSKELANSILAIVENEFGPDYRKVQFSISNEEFLERLSKLKNKVHQSPEFQKRVSKLLKDFDFNLKSITFDPPRLRGVVCESKTKVQSPAAHALHRDTWFANPQAQINFWIPLHDVTTEETFSFYPQYFQEAVENDSNLFDYPKWSKEVGFGRSFYSSNNSNTLGSNALYPTQTSNLPNISESFSFAAEKASILVFSAAHLHATKHNFSGATRFSIDFRVVDLSDHQSGIGAPNIDNNSKGTALVDYVKAIC
jgi:hypothetical protein